MTTNEPLLLQWQRGDSSPRNPLGIDPDYWQPARPRREVERGDCGVGQPGLRRPLIARHLGPCRKRVRRQLAGRMLAAGAAARSRGAMPGDAWSAS